MSPDARKPQQGRSRETQRRLLAAAITVIEERGLAGATVPEIAVVAEVSPGSLYRRFADKEALLRAAFLDLLERSAEANREGLRPDRLAGRSLEAAVGAVVAALIRQYRAHPGVLKALDQFMDTQVGTEFHDRASDLIAGNFAMLTGLLSPFVDRVAGDDPQRAIRFALLSAATLIELQTLHAPALWRRVLALDDKGLEAEVTRMVVAYLTRAE